MYYIQNSIKDLYLGDGENPPAEHLDFAVAYDNLNDKLKFQHLYLAEIGFALASKNNFK